MTAATGRKPGWRTTEFWLCIGICGVLVAAMVWGLKHERHALTWFVSIGLPAIGGYYAKLRNAIKLQEITMSTVPATGLSVSGLVSGLAPFALTETESVLPTLVAALAKDIGITNTTAVAYFQAAALNALKGTAVLVAAKFNLPLTVS